MAELSLELAKRAAYMYTTIIFFAALFPSAEDASLMDLD
jgi:hypothetical protein